MSKVNNPVTIVVPVYGDVPATKQCLEAVLDCVNLIDNHLIVINDQGPEAEEMQNMISALFKGQTGKNIRVVDNKKNLGFVGTCNKAVNNVDSTTNDILLLNSDTVTTEGFLEELTTVMYKDQNIATVTPRSDNATLVTFPLRQSVDKKMDSESCYACFELNHEKLERFNEMPTAHGFCVLIRRNVINEIGLFDEVFGKGYGEEVDFSQRAKQAGYINVVANHAFVFHKEARSFSKSLKQEMTANSRGIIEKMYPNYSDSVRNYYDIRLKYESKVGISCAKQELLITKVKRRLREIL